jgi:tetratricopeptide (TPR) repeat protein
MMTCELALAAALLAPAQTTRSVTGAVTSTLALDRSVADRRPVDEQIEVMRALLLRKLGRYDRPAAVYNWTPGKTDPGVGLTNSASVPSGYAAANYFGTTEYGRSTAAAATVEGAYLDGYGVVFTVATDATGNDPRPKTDGDKPAAPLTDWERTQRQLRGEPVPERAASAVKEPPLGEVLLKLLADNGKHFNNLTDGERVTIVVTFRGHAAIVSPNRTTASPAADANAQPLSAAQYPYPFPEDRVATMENLGDLHLKQGQPQRAIEAFSKAVELAEAESKGGKESDQRVIAVALKLANAYLVAGKEDEARAAMDRAKAAREKPSAAKTANKTAGAPLPGRLTVSATRQLLALVGNGKMTLDEFRKQATVEFVPAGK